jgi:hypothetical protein
VREKRVSKKRRGQPGKPVAVSVAPLDGDKTALTVRQAGVILAVGLAFGLGVIYEWGPLNGLANITKWGWPWQDLGTIQMGLALLAPFLLIVLVLWNSDRATLRVPIWFWLAALTLAQFCLQLFSVLADPRGAERILQIVSSADATSYFTDALNIHNLREWMSNFQQASLTGHSKSHPAGPILFYWVFAMLLGKDAGAFLGGIAVGFLASFGVVVMYHFAGLWARDRRVRLLASAFYALVPSFTVFFPEFDQIYPIFSMLMIFTFVKALNTASRWYAYALGMGATVFLAAFFAYNLLTVGLFPVYYGIYWLWRERGDRAAIVNVLRIAALALTAAISLYVLLWSAAGYNAIAALGHALRNVKGANESLGRPYKVSVFTDLYDFALGAGIIAVPILWFHFRKVRDQLQADREQTALTLVGLAMILTVDLSGLLRGETARIWMFLQPMLVVPVALELARLRWTWRLSILTVQWWLLVLIKAKMSFIEP